MNLLKYNKIYLLLGCLILSSCTKKMSRLKNSINQISKFINGSKASSNKSNQFEICDQELNTHPIPLGWGIQIPSLCLETNIIGGIQYSEFLAGKRYFLGSLYSTISINGDLTEGSHVKNYAPIPGGNVNNLYPRPFDGSVIEKQDNIAYLRSGLTRLVYIREGAADQKFKYSGTETKMLNNDSPWVKTLITIKNEYGQIVSVSDHLNNTTLYTYEDPSTFIPKTIEGPSKDYKIKIEVSDELIRSYSVLGANGTFEKFTLSYDSKRFLNAIKREEDPHPALQFERVYSRISKVTLNDKEGNRFTSRNYKACGNVIKTSAPFKSKANYTFQYIGTKLRHIKTESTQSNVTQNNVYEENGERLIASYDSNRIGVMIDYHDNTVAPKKLRSYKTEKILFTSTLANDPKISLDYATVKSFYSPLQTMEYQNRVLSSATTNGNQINLNYTNGSNLEVTASGSAVPGGTMTSTYSHDGLPTSKSTLGFQHHFNHDENGMLTQLINGASGHTTHNQIEDLKVRETSTLPVGLSEAMKYTAGGYPELHTRGIMSTAATYKNSGELTSVTSSIGGISDTTIYTSNASGLESTTSVNGKVLNKSSIKAHPDMTEEIFCD